VLVGGGGGTFVCVGAAGDVGAKEGAVRWLGAGLFDACSTTVVGDATRRTVGDDPLLVWPTVSFSGHSSPIATLIPSFASTTYEPPLGVRTVTSCARRGFGQSNPLRSPVHSGVSLQFSLQIVRTPTTMSACTTGSDDALVVASDEDDSA